MQRFQLYDKLSWGSDIYVKTSIYTDSGGGGGHGNVMGNDCGGGRYTGGAYCASAMIIIFIFCLCSIVCTKKSHMSHISLMSFPG